MAILQYVVYWGHRRCTKECLTRIWSYCIQTTTQNQLRPAADGEGVNLVFLLNSSDSFLNPKQAYTKSACRFPQNCNAFMKFISLLIWFMLTVTTENSINTFLPCFNSFLQKMCADCTWAWLYGNQFHILNTYKHTQYFTLSHTFIRVCPPAKLS